MELLAEIQLPSSRENEPSAFVVEECMIGGCPVPASGRFLIDEIEPERQGGLGSQNRKEGLSER